MVKAPAGTVKVLAFYRGSESVFDRILAIAPNRLNVVRGWDEFLDEMRAENPPRMMERFVADAREPKLSPEEREALLRETQVVLLGAIPQPRNLVPRMPNLRWAHLGFAGASNLRGTSWWDGNFTLTSSRGYTSALPIAESVVAAAFMFARRLNTAVERTLEHSYTASDYGAMKLVAGKTMAIIGLGGIGGNVARLAKAVGMRVIATRRSAKQRQSDVDGVDELFPPSELHAMLSEADFVAVCAMWTPETERMLNKAAFDALKPGAYLLNIARGELIEEAAMVEALNSGRLAGAYLDVWDDDMARLPSDLLQSAPNIVFSPHVSNRTDVRQPSGIDLFCENLERFLKGEPLRNVVDRARGY